jgi:hypothetical protein
VQHLGSIQFGKPRADHVGVILALLAKLSQDAEAAIADPVAFAAEGELPRLIDEVHLGGDWLVPAIKIAVDEDPRPGRFILSGSSRFLTVPTLLGWPPTCSARRRRTCAV